MPLTARQCVIMLLRRAKRKQRTSATLNLLTGSVLCSISEEKLMCKLSEDKPPPQTEALTVFTPEKQA